MKILSIDGGGILGLATASFLTELERHFDIQFHQECELFCGTSTGAIISLALAKGMTGKQILEFYKSLGPKVFGKPECWGWFGAKYKSESLKACLKEAFADVTIGDLKRKNKFVCIPAFSVTRGSPRVFKTDHSSQLSTDDNYKLVDIALASASAPTYFPVASVISPTHGTTEEFCDGGIFANHPALIGYVEAVHELKIQPKDIKLLSLSTPRKRLSRRPVPESDKRKLSKGILQWKSHLADCAIDGTSELTHQLLRRLSCEEGRTCFYERILLENEHEIPIDSVKADDLDQLIRLGALNAQSGEMRTRIEPFTRKN